MTTNPRKRLLQNPIVFLMQGPKDNMEKIVPSLKLAFPPKITLIELYIMSAH
jgi:hypothetical protein